MFLAISFALVFIAEIPLLPRGFGKGFVHGVGPVADGVVEDRREKAHLQKVHHRFQLLHGCLEPDAPDLYAVRICDFQWPRPGKHPTVTQ